MQTEITSAVKVFEEIEKLRRGFEAKLTHLGRNRRCLKCYKDWMPKAYEPCPQCGSQNTRLMRQRRRCLDCEHVWQPSAIGVCPWCGSPDSEKNPKDDPYVKEVILPRLITEEDFYEDQLKKMVEGHPAWEWPSQVKGAGLTTIGRLIGKIDIARLNTASEMWAHSGFGLEADGTRQRKRAGMKINYDAQLQSNCVILGQSLNYSKDSYYEFYIKEKELNSELPPRHAHNRAFRHMIKLFLSHFWQTWREAEGLPAPDPYVFDILKHPSGHLISPGDMVKKPGAQKVTEKQRRARPK